MTEKNRILQGIPASPGIVVGRAQVLTEAAQISTRLLYTDQDVAEEQERFRQAVEQIEAELTRLKDEISQDLKEHAHILELHLLILRDRMLYAETLRLIQEEKPQRRTGPASGLSEDQRAVPAHRRQAHPGSPGRRGDGIPPPPGAPHRQRLQQTFLV